MWGYRCVGVGYCEWGDRCGFVAYWVWGYRCGVSGYCLWGDRCGDVVIVCGETGVELYGVGCRETGMVL